MKTSSLQANNLSQFLFNVSKNVTSGNRITERMVAFKDSTFQEQTFTLCFVDLFFRFYL